MTQKNLKTIDSVIAALGRKEICAALGVSTAQISNRIQAGTFPAHWFDCLDRMASRHGFEIARGLFAWKRSEDAA